MKTKKPRRPRPQTEGEKRAIKIQQALDLMHLVRRATLARNKAKYRRHAAQMRRSA